MKGLKALDAKGGGSIATDNIRTYQTTAHKRQRQRRGDTQDEVAVRADAVADAIATSAVATAAVAHVKKVSAVALLSSLSI